MRWWVKWFLASVFYSGVWLSIGLKIYERIMVNRASMWPGPGLIPWEFFQLQVVLGFMGWMLLGIIIYLEAIKYDLMRLIKK